MKTKNWTSCRTIQEVIVLLTLNRPRAITFTNSSCLCLYSTVCFFFLQTGSSLFGMLGSSLRCVRSYSTVSPSPKMSPALLKLVRLVWINHKNVILLMADGTEYKYSV